MLTETVGPDAIGILRGLKEKYEGHHDVRIQDHAIVVAAQLSSRYITGNVCSLCSLDVNYLCIECGCI
jgi:ATP-dependent Clp protease ATP-binding subunit ClpA